MPPYNRYKRQIALTDLKSRREEVRRLQDFIKGKTLAQLRAELDDRFSELESQIGNLEFKEKLRDKIKEV